MKITVRREFDTRLGKLIHNWAIRSGANMLQKEGKRYVIYKVEGTEKDEIELIVDSLKKVPELEIGDIETIDNSKYYLETKEVNEVIKRLEEYLKMVSFTGSFKKIYISKEQKYIEIRLPNNESSRKLYHFLKRAIGRKGVFTEKKQPEAKQIISKAIAMDINQPKNPNRKTGEIEKKVNVPQDELPKQVFPKKEQQEKPNAVFKQEERAKVAQYVYTQKQSFTISGVAEKTGTSEELVKEILEGCIKIGDVGTRIDKKTSTLLYYTLRNY